jgi:hypothetical protein
MNIEHAVIRNLRLLPTEKQQDVLVFINSLLPTPPPDLKTHLRTQIIPNLQQIQHFHDNLPSAVYATGLLRSISTLPTSPITDILTQTLAQDHRWGTYTVEYYQTLIQILTDLTDRPTLTPIDLQSAAIAIEQISQTMTQPGIVTDQDLENHVEA